jgi:hypothetical protein
VVLFEEEGYAVGEFNFGGLDGFEDVERRDGDGLPRLCLMGWGGVRGYGGLGNGERCANDEGGGE